MTAESVDTLISARWVVPVEPAGEVLDHHDVAIRDGRIVAVLPHAEAMARFAADLRVDLSEHILIPGLVNSHTHAAMTLFRGLADDLPLMEWLQGHIWPAEQRWVSESFVSDGTRLALAEMVRGGTTCFNDMYFYADVTARAAASAGVRAVVGLIVVDFPTTWARDPDEYLAKGLAIHDQLRHEPVIHTAFAPHAPYSVSDEPLRRVATLAEELDVPVHIHLHETEDEINDSVGRFGKRPLARLDDLGLVSPRLNAVHMTHLTDDEIRRVGECGVSVAHCPESNLKLASGFCPVQRLWDTGIDVCLGTDGPASNNDLDMIGEMRTAALLGKAVAGDATALAAEQTLRMATINGARALGLDHLIGTLETGKSADMVAVDMGRIETQPVYCPISQMVYAAGREQVSDVWVAGRHLLRKGRLTTIDEDEVVANARVWRDRIAPTFSDR